VKGTSLLAIDSVDPKVAKPAAIINLPKPLAGRRHHAKSPQRTYDSVSHTVSIAITRGSPSSAAISLISASAQEVPAAARPAIAITHASDDLGGARAARRSTPAASAEATIHLPSPLPSPVTEPLRATATKLRATAEMKGVVSGKDTPSRSTRKASSRRIETDARAFTVDCRDYGGDVILLRFATRPGTNMRVREVVRPDDFDLANAKQRAGLVEREQRGSWAYFRVREEPLAALRALLA
jgi:hypothetical protein